MRRWITLPSSLFVDNFPDPVDVCLLVETEDAICTPGQSLYFPLTGAKRGFLNFESEDAWILGDYRPMRFR